MASVEDLPRGRVTGQYLFVSQDNEDAGTAPNAVIVSGYVRLTCSATPPLKYKLHKVSAVPLVHDAVFDSQGYLMPMTQNQSAIPGTLERGVEVLADGEGVNPRGFTWMVSFHLREVATGRTIVIPSFPIYVSDGDTVDLTDHMPVSESNGVRIIRGDSAYEVAMQKGFVGTPEEWLASLKGEQGDEGDEGPIGPTPKLEIGTVETVTNPADGVWIAGLIRQNTDVTKALADTFPLTMKGEKGDPGGFIHTTLNNVSLNTILTPGVYRQNTGVNATLANNYPKNADAGTLLVTLWGGTGEVMQEYTPYPINGQATGKWLRGMRGNGWSPWRFLGTQRVDNTAGRAIYTWDDTTNREQMIYGDTGWRDITALLPTAWSATKVTLRRVGMQVTLNFDGIKSDTATGNISFIQVPQGFAPDLVNGVGNLRYGIATDLSGSNGKVISPEPNSSGLRFLSYPTGVSLHGSVIFYTRDPWPTTLPGNTVGSVPNL